MHRYKEEGGWGTELVHKIKKRPRVQKKKMQPYKKGMCVGGKGSKDNNRGLN